MTISAIISTYNEEKRIAYALESLMWCDEIILLDKKSQDKTVEIASSFGNKVQIFEIENKPYFDPNEWTFLVNKTNSEWIIAFTASDLLHPDLAKQILELIKRKNFEYNIIYVPYRRFILGLDDKRSPWYSSHHGAVFRKQAISVNLDSVHNAAVFEGKIFYINPQQSNYIYHLTHETVNIMMDRHIRYWRGEANSSNINLKKDLRDIIKEFFKIIFLKKTYLLGKNGVMLIFAYLSYFMMSYVYKWEKTSSNAPLIYQKLRNEISDLWNN